MAGKDAIMARRRQDVNAAMVNTASRSDSKHMMLKLDQLVDREDNRDIDAAYAAVLADSIEKDGLGQPILVRTIAGEPGKYELVAGQHRREAYRILQQRHPGESKWERIEAIVRSGMDDDNARRLMYATNIANANVDDAYRVQIFDALGEEVDRMRAADPAAFEGKRWTEVVAEMVEEAGGEKISSRTIERKRKAANEAKAAAKAAEEGLLIDIWTNEFGKGAHPGSMKVAISGLALDEQRDLYERWEDAGRRKDWLKVELELRAGSADKVADGAYAAIEKNLGLLRRALSAGAGSEGLERIKAAIAAMEPEVDS